MIRRVTIFLLAFMGLLAADISARKLNPGDSNIHKYTLTRSVSIPLTTLAPVKSAEAEWNADRGALLASPGAEDELPEGPNGFDVLEDGSLLISDPLRDRIAVFDPDGKLRQSWKLDFAPDSVTLVSHEVVVVRDAATGQLHGFGVDGRSRSLPEGAPPKQGEVQLKSRNNAILRRPAVNGKPAVKLQIDFDRAGLSLLSVEEVGIDKDGNTYVALESTAGGDEVNVQKDVRKYSAGGQLLGEIAQIPLEYYIPPVNELRVRNGVVYQLKTSKSDVRINMWDTK